jgi:hypothetical protein
MELHASNATSRIVCNALSPTSAPLAHRDIQSAPSEGHATFAMLSTVPAASTKLMSALHASLLSRLTTASASHAIYQRAPNAAPIMYVRLAQLETRREMAVFV